MHVLCQLRTIGSGFKVQGFKGSGFRDSKVQGFPIEPGFRGFFNFERGTVNLLTSILGYI